MLLSVVVWNLNHSFHFVSSISTSKEFLIRYREPLAGLSFNNCHGFLALTTVLILVYLDFFLS